MKAHRMVPLLAALLAVCVTSTVGQAQASKKAAKAAKPAPAHVHPAAVAAKDTVARDTAVATPAVASAGDTVAIAAADTAPKKHGGFMGKLKGVAKNKVVRQVAKVAACTVVPGGQYVAGAIDAGDSKGVAGAAQGVAGAATGSSCMPGGAAGLAGGAGAGMPGGANMGLSAAQMAAMQTGGAGSVAGQAMMMAQMQQMQQMQQMMSPQAAGAGAMASEAPGQAIDLSSDVSAELTKGKTTVRNIDWVAGAPGVSAAGTPGFTDAMARLAAAMGQLGGSYRLDLYLDDRYEDVIVKTLGAQRLSMVQSALSGAPDGAAATPTLEIGKIKKDKHPRLEIVRRK